MPRWIHHLGWMFEGCVQFASTEPRTAGSVVVPIPEVKIIFTFTIHDQGKEIKRIFSFFPF